MVEACDLLKDQVTRRKIYGILPEFCVFLGHLQNHRKKKKTIKRRIRI